jgi:DNA-binding transcriptional LysR family regulator
MSRFRELEAFVAVVDAGSFVGGADVLNASKAAISRNVQELEERLGARLLNRTTRRLSLTEAGQAYYERARQILAELEDADSVVGATAARAVGRLRINAPQTFGVLHLAPLWGGFAAAYPEVELDITLSDRMVDLVEEGFDVAIRIARLQDSSLVSRRLAGTRLVACASPAYLAAHGAPATLADLARQRIIGYSYSTTGDTWYFDSPQGRQAVSLRPFFRSNSGDTCRAAALAGLGIAIHPGFMVEADMAGGRLVEVLPELRAGEIGIHAVYPSRKHLSGKVRALVDYLSRAFDHAPWNTDCAAAGR